MSFNVSLHPRQSFQITIQNTCKPEFDYKLYGLPKSTAPVHAQAASPTTTVETVSLDAVTFDDRFGSYLLEIVKKPGEFTCVEFVDNDGNPKAMEPDAKDNRDYNYSNGQIVDPAKGHWRVVDLKEVTVVVAVQPLEWEVGQDAALTFVPKTSVKYVLDSSKKIARDQPREEPGRINFATLTHAYAPDHRWGLAAGFGAVNNELEYYLGLAVGFGPRTNRVFNMAAGVVFTPVTILPAGVNEGDTAEASVLNNLPTKHVGRAFVAITATFFRASGTADKPQAKPD
jgi:hypothetical protein